MILIKELIKRLINFDSTLREMSETTKNEDDLPSPTNSVVSVASVASVTSIASSVASSRYKTRNNMEKKTSKSNLASAKIEDSIDTPTKYNLRRKPGSATAKMVEDIEKCETTTPSSTLTRKPRVSKRTAKQNIDVIDITNEDNK